MEKNKKKVSYFYKLSIFIMNYCINKLLKGFKSAMIDCLLRFCLQFHQVIFVFDLNAVLRPFSLFCLLKYLQFYLRVDFLLFVMFSKDFISLCLRKLNREFSWAFLKEITKKKKRIILETSKFFRYRPIFTSPYCHTCCVFFELRAFDSRLTRKIF